MENLDEQYENLYDFIKNLETLIQKNVFDNQKIEEISVFGKDVLNLCKSREFNINSEDLLSLNSFVELFMKANESSKGYLASQVETFYTEVIEPTKDELY
ncbi:TPA: hypothetical protein ACF4FK_001753 [Streptococcus pyogenes]|uniref:hypothetical protein n=2 Tax=Streptococcus pyogenes TaxID=1314 RepID=UPI000A1F0D21|nr:hypothetical protein [Streptococcus pyogenes]HER4683894.1 hypothetical protein [Streptococcus pyogenes NGAS358]HER4694398.1 hypothetical protein [Streptococcus pyogenes NGAS367]OUI72251.1 hypothetical protein B7R60_08165 [Streptococcus pyogenes]VGT69857.1 Uncharacterised protein [Streptococcus pyogenes]VGU24107.1 Uncharacterised protein [Streptococcus pyogenes]